MNQCLLPAPRISTIKQLNDDLLKRQVNFLPKNFFLFLIGLILLVQPFGTKAQETLMGMTSAGGAEGKGTIFTYKTNATAFTNS